MVAWGTFPSPSGGLHEVDPLLSHVFLVGDSQRQHHYLGVRALSKDLGDVIAVGTGLG